MGVALQEHVLHIISSKGNQEQESFYSKHVRHVAERRGEMVRRLPFVIWFKGSNLRPTGGHTKAASYRSFTDHETHYGLEEAIKVARMEYANIRATHDFATAHNIDCASNPCDTVDIIYSASHLASAKKAVARMQETMGIEDPAAAYKIHSAEEAHSRFLAPNALAAITYEAGSISGYKFVVGILKLCLARGLNLQTHTPVTRITASPTSTTTHPLWSVTTPRGTITAPNVLLATNGYTAHLLPQFQGTIVPLRGQVQAQRPGSALPNNGSLPHTYSFIYDSGYEYMITRPQSTATSPHIPNARIMIIGGGLGTLPADGAEEFGITDDGVVHGGLSEYLTECTGRYFGENWGKDDSRGRVEKEWTGIMGTSADGLPYVGQVEGMKGVWVCASFNGHGMVMCLKCAEAVVGMVLGDETWKEWFPKCCVLSEERLDRKFEGRLGMRAPGEAEFAGSEGCGRL